MQNLGLPSESVDDLLEGKLFESLAQSKYNPNSHTPTINNENMEIEELDDEEIEMLKQMKETKAAEYNENKKGSKAQIDDARNNIFKKK